MIDEEKARLAFHECCEDLGLSVNRDIESCGEPYWSWLTEDAWNVWWTCWKLKEKVNLEDSEYCEDNLK